MANQTDKARMLLPYLIGDMDAFQIADYCDSNGLSTDPVIDVLVEFILKKAESDAQVEQRLNGQLLDKMTEAIEALDFLGIASEAKQKVAPVGQMKPRPGPKGKYLPTILKLLGNGRLKKSELVKKVLAVHPIAGEGAIYRAISNAEKNGEVVPVGDFLYHHS